jgi:hypothetical protein
MLQFFDGVAIEVMTMPDYAHCSRKHDHEGAP